MELWVPNAGLDPGLHRDGKQRRAKTDVELQLSGHQLTTAEILYALPDYPRLLQTYVWQEYDLLPKLPLLHQFIAFWQRDIEGRLHQVTVSVREALGDARFTFYADEFETGN